MVYPYFQLLQKLHRKLVGLLAILIFSTSCENTPNNTANKNDAGETMQLKYAKGFSVTHFNDHTIIKILKPWPKAEKEYTFCVTDKSYFQKEKYDGLIDRPIDKLIVTSTTHIPALELLGVEETLSGFPGTDYISSKKTRKLIDEGKIRELGKNEGINTEVLLEINPDLVIGFGVDGVNKSFETIKIVGIPVMYNGDWVESSALAKAEWIKLFGVLFNKEKEADSIFNRIERDYLNAISLASKASKKPTVISGAMHKDVWYLPNGSSSEAKFLKDANVDYLWNDTIGNGSLALSFEAVFEKGQNAELWLSPSYYTSFQQLEDASSLYTKFKAFKSRNIFTFSSTTGDTGGVLYYELGSARPDLILKDLIKICHPELLNDYTPYFFKRLD